MAPPRSREEALDERRLDPPSTERRELSQLRQAELGQQLYAAAIRSCASPPVRDRAACRHEIQNERSAATSSDIATT